MVEDFSEELANTQRRFDAARQDLFKKANTSVEVEANQGAKQEAIISNLSQVGLSHTHTTVTSWRRALQALMAVHLSATPYMMESTHDVNTATLGRLRQRILLIH